MVLEADERAARVADLLAKKQAEQKERDAVKRRLAEDAVRRRAACVAVGCRTCLTRPTPRVPCRQAERRQRFSKTAVSPADTHTAAASPSGDVASSALAGVGTAPPVGRAPRSSAQLRVTLPDGRVVRHTFGGEQTLGEGTLQCLCARFLACASSWVPSVPLPADTPFSCLLSARLGCVAGRRAAGCGS